MEKQTIKQELISAIFEMKRCMGGIDASGCVAAARKVSELRIALAKTIGSERKSA